MPYWLGEDQEYLSGSSRPRHHFQGQVTPVCHGDCQTKPWLQVFVSAAFQ